MEPIKLVCTGFDKCNSYSPPRAPAASNLTQIHVVVTLCIVPLTHHKKPVYNNLPMTHPALPKSYHPQLRSVVSVFGTLYSAHRHKLYKEGSVFRTHPGFVGKFQTQTKLTFTLSFIYTQTHTHTQQYL